jgi:dihydrofolate reductase
MGKIILFIASSIDGYIADSEDGLEWLIHTQGEGDNGFDAMYNRISSIVMGRKTYDIVCDLVGHYPHADKQSYIFSHSQSTLDPAIQFVSGDVETWLNGSGILEKGDVWLVGGATLVKQFLESDLIDELILTIAPLHLGLGVPLHLPFQNALLWELVRVDRSGQFAQLEYHRLRNTE